MVVVLAVAGKAKKESEWFTRRQVAAFLGVSAQAVQQHLEDRMLPDAKRVVGNRTELHGPSAVHAYIARESFRPNRPGGVGILNGEAIPEGMQGPLTPGLERWRVARAQMAEMELQAKQGLTCSVDAARRMLVLVIACLREPLEILMRQFGPVAYRIMAKGLDDAERTVADWKPDADA